MVKISINVIQTSSKGNCFILNDGSSNLILDFGATRKNIENSFLHNNIKSSNTAGILITHAHGDHSCGLYENIASKHSVFAPKGVWTELNNSRKSNIDFNRYEVIIDKWTRVGNSKWKFKAIKTIHNSLDSVCYLIKRGNKKLLYLTDSEYIENKNFKGINCFLIECNYGNYNTLTEEKTHKHFDDVKNHMNSVDVEKFILKYKSIRTKLILLIHLSSQNNNNFEIVDHLIKRYETKKLIINKVKPDEINTFKIEF